MIQTNIKSDRKDRGFTIVELLVVIVVIGILAAITIVSYTGITTRAKTSQAQSNAQSVQSVAEVYFTEQSHYPRVTTDFAATVAAKLPSGVSLFYTGGTGVNATPSGTNGQTTIYYQYCGAVAAPTAGNETGGRIRFWDFQTSALSTTVYYFGTGSSSGGAGAAPCWSWVDPAS